MVVLEFDRRKGVSSFRYSMVSHGFFRNLDEVKGIYSSDFRDEL